MLYGKVHQKWFKIKVLKGSYKTLCWHCIVKPLSKLVAGVIKFKLTLWFYVSSLVRKFSFINLVMSFSSSRHQKKKQKTKKQQLHNLRSCRTIQIQIGGLKTKHLFVNCLQRVDHYFKTVKNKSDSILLPQKNK